MESIVISISIKPGTPRLNRELALNADSASEWILAFPAEQFIPLVYLYSCFFLATMIFESRVSPNFERGYPANC